MPNDAEKIEEGLTELFGEMLGSLPSGRASFDLKMAPQIQHDGVSISLVPANRTAAPIVVDARNGFPVVSLVLGK